VRNKSVWERACGCRARLLGCRFRRTMHRRSWCRWRPAARARDRGTLRATVAAYDIGEGPSAVRALDLGTTSDPPRRNAPRFGAGQHGLRRGGAVGASYAGHTRDFDDSRRGLRCGLRRAP